jgi:hypothetical protein
MRIVPAVLSQRERILSVVRSFRATGMPGRSWISAWLAASVRSTSPSKSGSDPRPCSRCSMPSVRTTTSVPTAFWAVPTGTP